MKKLSKFMAIILCIMMIGGCGAKKLSSAYSEDKLKIASEEIISNLDNEKYDDVVAKFDSVLKDKLPASKLKEAWGNFKNLGKYDSISNIAFQEKNNNAVVVATAKYEKGKIIFTLSFNKDMKLNGIFMR